MMYSNKPIIYKEERRQKPDIINRWLEVTGFLVWVILFVIVFLFENAKPVNETFFDRLLGLKIREAWDYRNFNIVLFLLLFLFLLSTFSLILNLKRLKRSTDRIRISFVLSLVGSLVGIVLYLFSF